ncbi:Protein kinase and PP2C-like domain-containing protein [Camellia lanceoleosa]|uniref:Protein kinase and PP2C-like domain-containing protein n=1 Tax=Camellia lanceoleosa TaxID=1840588 RepID=A0ACC0GKB2_9ERIC|nr:Protein kinase and PP2C-like domain-containing protein [Camellia lanceoleosa]
MGWRLWSQTHAFGLLRATQFLCISHLLPTLLNPIARVRSSRIATLVAAHAKPPNYIFFFKCSESLNLAEKLHMEEWNPTFDQVLTISVQLAKALQHLHKLGIVHRNVKPANILLDENLRPHLADFGLAEYKKDLKRAHAVLEMNYTEQQLTAAVVSEGLRPALAGHSSSAPTGFPSLIQRCWDANPQNRPSFDDIILELDPILECRKRVEEDEKEKALVEPSIPLGDEGIPSLLAYQKSINWFTEGENLSKRSCLAADSGVRIWPDPFTDPSAYHPVLSWGSFGTCGRRETMEDTHFLMPHMCGEKDIHVFGIFDGHRGAAAAEFSARALPGFLQSLGSKKSPSDALLEAFVKTDVAFRNELDSHRKSKGVIQKDWHPGCTAIVALIVRNKLFVANAGDCRAMLCRAGSAYALSKDHVASCPEERERIISEGGQVKWQVDTWRVGPAALQRGGSLCPASAGNEGSSVVTMKRNIMQVGLKAFDVVVDGVDRKKMWVAKKGRSLQRSLMLGFEVPLLAQKKLLNS